jgi:hypothetical protein
LPDCRAGEPLTALASSWVRKTRSVGGDRIVPLGAGLRYSTPGKSAISAARLALFG